MRYFKILFFILLVSFSMPGLASSVSSESFIRNSIVMLLSITALVISLINLNYLINKYYLYLPTMKYINLGILIGWLAVVLNLEMESLITIGIVVLLYLFPKRTDFIFDTSVLMIFTFIVIVLFHKVIDVGNLTNTTTLGFMSFFFLLTITEYIILFYLEDIWMMVEK